jgi:glycine betaine/proline transport system substrate-binding protein
MNRVLTSFKPLLLMSVLFALALFPGPAGLSWAAERPVRLGQIGISFYAVTGQVVQSVLERLGHHVELRTGSHSQIFPQLGEGSIDLLVAAWLPHAHANYWREHGADAVQLATLYRGAQLFWAVPDYVPAREVASVEDLKKAAVSSRMSKDIRATRPDSGLTMGSKRIMQAYDLEKHGYRLVTGEHREWQQNFEARHAAGDWFVMPYFRPNFLNRMARMRKLDEPRDLLGSANRAVLVAHRAFVANAPDRTLDVLRRIELDLDAVAEMDFLVRVDGLGARDAANRWMSTNAGRVDAWFANQ